jgi:hypothetical protein
VRLNQVVLFSGFFSCSRSPTCDVNAGLGVRHFADQVRCYAVGQLRHRSASSRRHSASSPCIPEPPPSNTSELVLDDLCSAVDCTSRDTCSTTACSLHAQQYSRQHPLCALQNSLLSSLPLVCCATRLAPPCTCLRLFPITSAGI